eukprot:GHVQ01012301.1.p1 GENE.GHVQ01012301.1~~GHVQ01012301.1.p1  ORF type:complete len:637 (-),score=61.83 GHVQ01012301.1:4948-6858(-)
MSFSRTGDSADFLVECDDRVQAALWTMLKKHKLRSDVSLIPLPPSLFRVFQLLPPPVHEDSLPYSMISLECSNSNSLPPQTTRAADDTCAATRHTMCDNSDRIGSQAPHSLSHLYLRLFHSLFGQRRLAGRSGPLEHDFGVCHGHAPLTTICECINGNYNASESLHDCSNEEAVRQSKTERKDRVRAMLSSCDCSAADARLFLSCLLGDYTSATRRHETTAETISNSRTSHDIPDTGSGDVIMSEEQERVIRKVWEDVAHRHVASTVNPRDALSSSLGFISPDPRYSGLGYRLLSLHNTPSNFRSDSDPFDLHYLPSPRLPTRRYQNMPPSIFPASLTLHPASPTTARGDTSSTPLRDETGLWYMFRRLLCGVVEGSMEVRPNAALPFSVNADFMDMIHTRKGCYSGQELTNRTYNLLPIRRRHVIVVAATNSTLLDALGRIPFSRSLSEHDVSRLCHMFFPTSGGSLPEVETFCSLIASLLPTGTAQELSGDAASSRPGVACVLLVRSKSTTENPRSELADGPARSVNNASNVGDIKEGKCGTGEKGGARNSWVILGDVVTAVGNVGLAEIRLKGPFQHLSLKTAESYTAAIQDLSSKWDLVVSEPIPGLSSRAVSVDELPTKWCSAVIRPAPYV